MSSLSMINFGPTSSWLQIADEEIGGLWQSAYGYGYRNREPQAISWQWQALQKWTNSGFLSGDSTVPLCLFGLASANSGFYEPWSLGLGGKTRPFFIRGICKNAGGTPLGGAVVYAVRASDNAMVGSVACDDRGVFEVPTLDTTPHFVHSFYASGSLAGRSVATLTPAL